MSGGAGGDRINLRDGRRDDVACGEGPDSLVLDGFDFFTSLEGACEGVQRDAPAGAIFNDPSSEPLETRLISRTAFARLGCPGDAPPFCEGTVRLDVSGRTGEPVSFSIARDEFAVVELALDEQAIEQANRKGSVAATLVIETNQPGAAGFRGSPTGPASSPPARPARASGAAEARRHPALTAPVSVGDTLPAGAVEASGAWEVVETLDPKDRKGAYGLPRPGSLRRCSCG